MSEGAGVIKRIYTLNLGVKEAERVLVFTDIVGEDPGERGRVKWAALRRITADVAAAGQGLCDVNHLEFPTTGGHGKEPPLMVWEAAFGKRIMAKLFDRRLFKPIQRKEIDDKERDICFDIVREHEEDCTDAVIALSTYSTSHTFFRNLLTEAGGTRYASMPLFEESMLTGVMTADWREVERRTVKLMLLMSGSKMVHLTTPAGTRINFSIEGREPKADTGILTRPGTFGNLPAGEAFLAPLEGTAAGTLVLEWAPTRKLECPVRLRVAAGRVLRVEADDVREAAFAEDLNARIAEEPLIGNIAELGIGTNDKATKLDNILETEKILGTVHIALGDNSNFGGTVSVPFHQDFIFFKPSLEIERDGERIAILADGIPEF